MLQSNIEVIALLPDRPPDRNIIKLSITDVGDVTFLVLERLANRVEGVPNLLGLAQEALFLAGEEPMVEDAPTSPSTDPEHVQRSVARDGALSLALQLSHPHQVGHLTGVRLPKLGGVNDRPDLVLIPKLLDSPHPEPVDQVRRPKTRALGRLPLGHPPNPLLAMRPTGRKDWRRGGDLSAGQALSRDDPLHRRTQRHFCPPVTDQRHKTSQIAVEQASLHWSQFHPYPPPLPSSHLSQLSTYPLPPRLLL